jgi:CarD family transcriptional regulator
MAKTSKTAAKSSKTTKATAKTGAKAGKTSATKSPPKSPAKTATKAATKKATKKATKTAKAAVSKTASKTTSKSKKSEDAKKMPSPKPKVASKQIAVKKPAATKTAAKAAPKAAAKAASSKAAKASPKKAPAEKKAAVSKKAVEKAPVVEKKAAQGFRVNEHVVYPAHGVGQITEISQSEVAGISLELFVVYFEKEKMTLRVPLAKAKSIGMRKLADKDMLDAALKTLRGRARVKRTMWSRRAQEYEAKINSGDMVAIAEVVRDLFRNENQPEQSYSERQLYEAALDRMAREYATIRKLSDDEAILELEAILAKTTGGAPKVINIDG